MSSLKWSRRIDVKWREPYNKYVLWTVIARGQIAKQFVSLHDLYWKRPPDGGLSKYMGVKTLPTRKHKMLLRRGRKISLRSRLILKMTGFWPVIWNMVGVKGIEPPRASSQDPKSSASTNFATRPHFHYLIVILFWAKLLAFCVSAYPRQASDSSPHAHKNLEKIEHYLFNCHIYFRLNICII